MGYTWVYNIMMYMDFYGFIWIIPLGIYRYPKEKIHRLFIFRRLDISHCASKFRSSFL